MATVDLSGILQIVLGLAAAAVAAAIPILVPFILKRIGIANDADLAAKLDAALTAGAGAAYNYGLSQAQGLSSVPVHNTAVAVGAGYVISKLPEALDHFNITADGVKERVAARLGVLLASDPTVTAGPLPPSVTNSPAVLRG